MLEGFDLSQAVRRKRWRPGGVRAKNRAGPKQSLMDARGVAISRAA